MFKSVKWRNDKKKIICHVYKLQFHATQVSWSGGDTLMISVVRADGKKPTSISDKVKIRDGSCYWERPVYETMKFTHDIKTGKIDERSYNVIISSGLSKVGHLGEVSINFADYALSAKISSLSLPVKNMKFGAVLHVTIERILDQREFEEVETLKDNPKDQSLRAQLSNGDIHENIETIFPKEGSSGKIISHVAVLNENCTASSRPDITISSPETSSGQNMPQVISMTNVKTSQIVLAQRSEPDAPTEIYTEQQGLQSEWSRGSIPDASTDDSSNSPREDLTVERSHDTSEILIEKLKTELAVLARQAEVSDLELQTLRKNIVKESKRALDLSREVVSLKEERDLFREEYEKTKVQNKLQYKKGDPRALFEELRQELKHEKDLNANLRIQFEKTQESNTELILAVQDLDEMLEEKNREIRDLSNISATTKNTKGVCEKALKNLGMEHTDAKDSCMQEQKIIDFCSDEEFYRRERDDMEMQMEQLSLDYEILKQENHDISNKLRQSQFQDQLHMHYECSECATSYSTLNSLQSKIRTLDSVMKKQSKEFSDSLLKTSDLENHIKNLENELEEQAQGFQVDIEKLTRAKVEQEQRAIRAEDNLRKTRRQNANTADRLQDEFRRLSKQMSSTFNANEKIATKALTEANELRLEKKNLEEMSRQAKEEVQSIREHYEAKLLELSSQLELKLNQIEELQSEVECKSIELEKQRKHAEETQRTLSQNILSLQLEIERLEGLCIVSFKQEEENDTLRAELEEMKALVKDRGSLLENADTERNELESTVALLKTEAQSLLKELTIMRKVKDEAKSMAENLQADLDALETQYSELKLFSAVQESQKEKLQKQVSQLKIELKKKEEALSIVVKKIKDGNGRAPVSEVAKARNTKYVPSPRGSKEVVLKEKIRLLEGQIKMKEAAFEMSSNTFVAKEQDLQGKIQELKRTSEILNKNAASSCGYDCQKGSTSENLNVRIREKATFGAQDSTTKTFTIEEMRTLSVADSDTKDPGIDSRDCENLDKLSNEIAVLKERNQSMECELRDMQQRYSQISLKFAEVEGERQQLVMTLRNLRNSSKSWSFFP